MTIRDDTGRELLASEARIPLEDAAFLRAVLEAVPAFILRLDPDRRISYINHLRPGVGLEEVIGSSATDYVMPEHRERYEAAIDQAIRTGEQASFEVKGFRGDNVLHLEGRAVPIDHGDGRLGVCMIVIDVSQRVANNAALRASEEKLRIAVEATGIGLWSWDAATDALAWSPRMVEIHGQKSSTAREYLEQVVHPDDRQRIRKESQLGGREVVQSPHRIVRPDGEVRWVMTFGRRVSDEDGSTVRVSGGTLDVTPQRALDERLREAQKLDAIGSLTAGVAHNFNNMLAVILPALDMAVAKASDSEIQVYSDAAQAARRAAELVNQLMTFGGQRRASEPRAHDIAELIERTVSMCQRTFDRQVQIELRMESPRPTLVCDGTAIEQILVNLLINARDALAEATPADPSITVELSTIRSAQPDPSLPRGRYHCIQVQDNGAGMSAAVKQRLFEPFFTTKGPDRGTGLGLATSYGIARDHGGCIAVESQVGQGTTAKLFLPVSDSDTPPPRISEPKPSLPASPRAGTIMVVDDEPALRHIVDVALSARGHEVVRAGDAREAIAQLDGGLQPDLILLDRSMPGMQLKQALVELRQRRAAVPIVLFTGQDVTAEERAAVQDVLYKPLALDELVHSVERWL